MSSFNFAARIYYIRYEYIISNTCAPAGIGSTFIFKSFDSVQRGYIIYGTNISYPIHEPRLASIPPLYLKVSIQSCQFIIPVLLKRISIMSFDGELTIIMDMNSTFFAHIFRLLVAKSGNFCMLVVKNHRIIFISNTLLWRVTIMSLLPGTI